MSLEGAKTQAHRGQRERGNHDGVVREGRNNRTTRGPQSRVLVPTGTSTKKENDSARDPRMTDGTVVQFKFVVEG